MRTAEWRIKWRMIIAVITQLLQLRKESLHLIIHSAVLHDFHTFITSSSSFHGFITNQFNDLLPDGFLISLIGRALHRYRRGQGFESRTSLNFIQPLFSQLHKLRIYIHNFKSETCFNQSEALWVVTPHWSSSVGLCWYEISTRVSQTSFRGGTSSGRPFSGQQTINIKTFNTLFFLFRDIFFRHTTSLLSCHASGVTNWLIPSKNCEIEKSKN